MPDMDGLTLAGEIRRHRDAHALPLVMLTSLGRSEKTPVEFAAYLTKPIKPSQLHDALMVVFGGELELARALGRRRRPMIGWPNGSRCGSWWSRTTP